MVVKHRVHIQPKHSWERWMPTSPTFILVIKLMKEESSFSAIYSFIPSSTDTTTQMADMYANLDHLLGSTEVLWYNLGQGLE